MTPPPAARLLDMARSPRRADRGALVEALTAICFAPGRRPSDRELALAFEILRALIHEVEVHARRITAERLSDREDAPHDIVMQLAGDVIEVAYPVLVRSPVLQDSDLVSLILAQTEQHRLAISKRRGLSPAVSETLIETGDARIIASLLENDAAQIRSEAMARLAESTPEMEEIREPLLRRRGLALTQLVPDWTDAAQHADSGGTYRSEEGSMEEAVSRAVAEAIGPDILEEEGDWHGLGDLFAPAGAHPAAELLKALRDGDVLRFEELFRDATALSADSVTRVLYDSGAEELAIASKAVGFGRAEFAALFCHLHGSRPFDQFRGSEAFRQAMDCYDQADPAAAGRVLQTWRDAPNDRWGG